MTGNGSGSSGPPYYGRARIIGGLLLLGLAAVLMLADALLPTYNVPDSQLGLVLGTGVILLGVELGKGFLGGRGP